MFASILVFTNYSNVSTLQMSQPRPETLADGETLGGRATQGSLAQNAPGSHMGKAAPGPGQGVARALLTPAHFREGHKLTSGNVPQVPSRRGRLVSRVLTRVLVGYPLLVIKGQHPGLP